MLETATKNISKIMTLPNNLVYLFAGFNTTIMCSVYYI